MVNTVLAAICAKTFKEFSDKIKGGQNPKTIAKDSLKLHWKVIFNGNGYDPENQKKLTDMGLWRFDSCIDSILRLTEEKNIALFEGR